MKNQKELMIDNSNSGLRLMSVGCRGVTWLSAALVLGGCGKPVVRPPEESLVRTSVVQPMDGLRSDGQASYLAMVKFDHETDLSFKVGGILVSVGPIAGTDWDEGTPVKAGTVLAELKQGDFTNALNSARAHADLAGKTLERFRKLRVTDAISQQELDSTEADWRTAQSQLDQAEQNLRDSRLLVTKDGVVLMRYVNSRVTVAPGQRVLRFADTSVMSVELGLPDRLIARLTPGKEVPVEVSGFEGLAPFRGRVSEVGVAASSEGRLFRVVIKVPNPDGLLRSGMTARIHVGDAPGEKSGTVCVPLSALVTLVPDGRSAGNSQASTLRSAATEDGSTLRTSPRGAPPLLGSTATEDGQLGVFVVQNGKAVTRAVKTGDILNSSILITDGLRAGEQVVTSGASFLYDGAPIEVAADTLASK